MKKDYIDLDCDLPWMERSYIRVYQVDRTWPLHLLPTVQISFIRKDVQMDLDIGILLRREQIVELRDFLDSVLKEKEAKVYGENKCGKA